MGRTNSSGPALPGDLGTSWEVQVPPKTDGILESCLYVSDVPRSAGFYRETFGFTVISEFGGRGCAMAFGPGLTAETMLFRTAA